MYIHVYLHTFIVFSPTFFYLALRLNILPDLYKLKPLDTSRAKLNPPRFPRSTLRSFLPPTHDVRLVTVLTFSPSPCTLCALCFLFSTCSNFFLNPFCNQRIGSSALS